MKSMDYFLITVYQISNIIGSKSLQKQNKIKKEKKYSSRNSPTKNSVSNYNQIYTMSVVCKEYIAKSVISGNGKIAVKS